MARKNTTETFNAWKSGKTHRKCRSIWTSGGVIYSYSTPIAKFSDVTDMHAIVNMNRYSVTTTIHQNGLLALMRQNGMFTVVTSECSFDEVSRA